MRNRVILGFNGGERKNDGSLAYDILRTIFVSLYAISKTDYCYTEIRTTNFKIAISHLVDKFKTCLC